jgi:hypothetical protein
VTSAQKLPDVAGLTVLLTPNAIFKSRAHPGFPKWIVTP